MMDNAVYLQNLDEYILDEEKIVTARWLSKNLNIKHQLAIDLLTSWVENNATNTELAVTYAVTGTKKDGALIVTVSREQAVESLTKNLNNVTKSVYSVQKGSLLKDIQLLAIVDPKFVPSLGAIRYHTAAKIPDPPISQAEIPQPTEQQKAIIQREIKSITTINTSKTNTTEKSQENDTSAKVKDNVKGGIANFFNKPGAKSAITSKKVTPPVKNNSSRTVQDFFKKTGPTVTVTSDVKNLEENIEKDAVKEEIQVSEDDIIQNTPEVKKERPKKRVSRKNNDAKKSKRIRENSDEDNNIKRRKRIMMQSDSSDDDIFGKENDDLVNTRETERTAESIKEIDDVVHVSPPPLNKSKRKKVVNKTYADEDGFIITVRAEEECSGSEEEIAKPAPAPVPKSSPVKSAAKKSTSHANTKQSNLMNFFKKK